MRSGGDIFSSFKIEKDAVFVFYFKTAQFLFKSRKGDVLKQINGFLEMNVQDLTAQTI